LVEPSWRSCGERKKKKETSAVKYNTSGHYRGRRCNKKKNVVVIYSLRSLLLRDAAEKLKLTQLLRFDVDRKFENSASGVLEELYESNPTKASKLLERPLQSWGQRTLLAVADTAQQMDFLEHECCQTKIKKTWFGKIATYTTMRQASVA